MSVKAKKRSGSEHDGTVVLRKGSVRNTKASLHYIALTELFPPVREGASASCSPASEAFWLLAAAFYLLQTTLIAGWIER